MGASFSLAGFLDKFFDGLSNNNNESDKIGPNNNIVEEIDGIYTGSKRIITIPGKSEVVRMTIDT